jgi:hypothetical protein
LFFGIYRDTETKPDERKHHKKNCQAPHIRIPPKIIHSPFWLNP